MQNSVLKFLTTFLVIILISATTSRGQSQQHFLLRADSLFQQKRYTQSFEIYNSLFQQQHYTPAMLLKMAYIQEGLNHISQSAYYLNLYYLATRDEAALTKLDELATKFRLEGYAADEFDRAYLFYDQYKNLITIALFSAAVFLITFCAIQRLRFHTKPYTAWSILLVLSALLFVHLYAGDRRSQAIIMNNNTYLMDAPSAGASVISIVRDGHRVQVLGKKDVWLRVTWGDSDAYIKESNLMPVKL
jgi:hypothetical protein